MARPARWGTRRTLNKRSESWQDLEHTTSSASIAGYVKTACYLMCPKKTQMIIAARSVEKRARGSLGRLW